ncbi:hypothetical protein DXG01_008880 [Tephrocybe rancida]|nr:hypothetical protein DXG01_008880 [Tephrocybe rancida]
MPEILSSLSATLSSSLTTTSSTTLSNNNIELAVSYIELIVVNDELNYIIKQ